MGLTQDGKNHTLCLSGTTGGTPSRLEKGTVRVRKGNKGNRKRLTRHEPPAHKLHGKDCALLHDAGVGVGHAQQRVLREGRDLSHSNITSLHRQLAGLRRALSQRLGGDQWGCRQSKNASQECARLGPCLQGNGPQHAASAFPLLCTTHQIGALPQKSCNYDALPCAPKLSSS